jgi:hypothetical protein
MAWVLPRKESKKTGNTKCPHCGRMGHKRKNSKDYLRNKKFLELEQKK